MQRPAHLPNFTNPPIDEVVIGVQFEPIPGFSSVHTKEVWDLFRGGFPTVQEQPLLQPQFETFGGSNLQPSFQFQISSGPVGSRLWFISEQENSLLQFQSDRFLANWKKNPTQEPYPRFEGISDAFRNQLNILSNHVLDFFRYKVAFNQAEVTYVNVIPVSSFSEIGSWLKLWNCDGMSIEAVNTMFSEVIFDEVKKPFARLFYEIQSVYTVDGQDIALKLSLTFRGKPFRDDIESVFDFLKRGREEIVMKFKSITTPSSHELWGLTNADS